MGAAGSVNKVFWSELDIALHETALDLLGAGGRGASRRWLDGYLFSLSGPIYAGTNEIQRNIVAERILGLPREPKGAGRVRFVLTDEQRDFAAVARRRCSPRPTPSAVARAWADGDTRARPRRCGRGSPSRASPSLADRRPTPGRGVRRVRGARPARRARPVGRVRGLPPGRRSAARSTGVATVAAAPARAVRARRRRRRPGVRRRRRRPTSRRRSASARSTAPGGCSEVDRRPATPSDDRRRSTSRSWPRPPSCSAPASGCWPTRSTYVKQRKQFGREIGSYQAIKHQLADVRIALDFARPLVLRRRARRGRRPRRRRSRARDAAYLAVPHRPAGARRDRLHRRSST